ncbi:ABC transporter permease [Oceanobacillus caeni]|uniref:ABC transporter permease n=1 Tax=Oceanobacillus caeni TaxID=405946 RepID=UPI00214A15E8|nr:ABC transporter permease [Oceanobacillus caeni]MCR1835307.1 ABC transporter permease [Oceanobacillus caeni]MED4475060.1 ABC transporter permease [Oceanobacillus caeni]
MSFKQLIFRNLKKNLSNYYLYVFALVFSVALYFAFVTLQYDPSMDEVEGSIKGAAALRAGAVMLIAIIIVFLIYANNLFIKRRSKEIGLLQLVGLTKGKIFQILSVENMMLYFGSMLIGIFVGFSVSKLLMMILIKIMGINEVATLRFSVEALIQTAVVFVCIYVVIMAMNALFIKRQRILHLFQVTSKTEGKVNRVSVIGMLIGVLGIGLIAFGYYLSTRLFSGDFTELNALYFAMLTILGSVIVGTYLFYKGSVSFIFNMIRKKDNGYLSINKVLSLSSIMFRMKSNSILLTIITTVSALAIGLLSLTYISYYSTEKTAEESLPNHFSIPNEADAARFMDELEAAKIEYTEKKVDFHQVHADLSRIMETYDEENGSFNPGDATMVVISDEAVEGIDLSRNESIIVNFPDTLQQFMSLKETGQISLKGQAQTVTLNYKGLEDRNVLPSLLTLGGFPVAVVDQGVYQQLKEDMDESIQKESTVYVGVDVKDKGEIEEADKIFQELGFQENFGYSSRLYVSSTGKITMGLAMFLVGFFGLTFLITSGCILYFKQMDESEEEKGTYTILRKLGFTNKDLLNGIRVKQLFNFGIPLVVGLCHSYFAVKSGWFFFGTELWTPMIIVMVLYTLLYSIFGLLSVLYYKKVIKDSL